MSSFSTLIASAMSPALIRSPRSEARICSLSFLVAFGALTVSMVIDGATNAVGPYPSHCIRSMKKSMS